MRFYGVAEDYEYTSTHKRERLSIWSGPFSSVYEGEAFTLPKGDGYMVTTYNGKKVRVSCPTPRRDDNYTVVDDAINAALNAHYALRLEYLRGEIRAERIGYAELAELQGLAPFINAGDVELLEWAGVSETAD